MSASAGVGVGQVGLAPGWPVAQGFAKASRTVSLLSKHGLCPCCPPRSFNVVNSEHQAIAKELEKAQADFREFERKDIKFRWDGV